MLDLDDPQFIATAHTLPLYGRASQYRRRHDIAHRLAADFYPHLDHVRANLPPVCTTWIAVLIPPELHGMSQIARAIAHSQLSTTLTFHEIGPPHTDTTQVDRRQNALSPPPAPTLILDAIPPSLARWGTVQRWTDTLFPIPPDIRIDISTIFNADSHPVVALLFLLLLAGYYNHTSLDLNLPDPLLQRLQSYSAETPTLANPAKTLARQLYARVPIFWGAPAAVGLAADYALRHQWYAESAALTTDLWELARTHIMSRFPRYWPNTAAFVHVTAPYAAPDRGELRDTEFDTDVDDYARMGNKDGVDEDGVDEGRELDEDRLTGTLHTILARRNFAAHRVSFAGPSLLLRSIDGLEFGEWLALYAATLYEVDPTARVPFQLLF